MRAVVVALVLLGSLCSGKADEIGHSGVIKGVMTSGFDNHVRGPTTLEINPFAAGNNDDYVDVFGFREFIIFARCRLLTVKDSQGQTIFEYKPDGCLADGKRWVWW